MRRFLGQAVVLVGWVSLGCTSVSDPTDDGSVRPSQCSVEELECSGVCANLQTSALHCGGCGVVCEEGRACQNGVCGEGSSGDGTGGSGGTGSLFATEILIEEGQLGQCEVDGIVEATNGGFSGKGYINSDNVLGASIEWMLSVGQAGNYSIEFAYANASGDRPADVLVGGVVAQRGVPFALTSSWSEWSSVKVDVSLVAGENRIGLRATNATGLANIDSLKATGTSVSAGDCDEAAGTGGMSGSGGSTGGTDGAEVVPPCSINELAACSKGTNEIACHFGGEPGDYRVTVELGGATAGDMVVDAEMYRRMLGQTTTLAGEKRRYSFVTNVRSYEGQPLDPDQKGSSKGIAGLDVYVRGAAPKLGSICHELVAPAPKVWIAGDSTVCDQAGTDFSGWGQHVSQFFDSPLSIANYADSGESSVSFLSSSKLWKTIAAGWKTGDWVMIQLGHNDKNVTAATFKANLKQMVVQAKAAGVHPLLITPISRAGTVLESQHTSSTGANLPQIIRDLGAEEGVPVIDLTVTTWQWLQTIDWKSYFALGTDRTHTNQRGAEVIAGFVANAIRQQQLELATHLR